MKILQTKVEGKQTEIQRLQDKCALDEKEIQDLQKMCSNVSEERDSLFLRSNAWNLYRNKFISYQNNNNNDNEKMLMARIWFVEISTWKINSMNSVPRLDLRKTGWKILMNGSIWWKSKTM